MVAAVVDTSMQAPANAIRLPLPANRGGGHFWTRGHLVIAAIETHCVFTNGRWRGKPFVLEDWQKRLILELFTVEWYEEEQAWLRRYRWALIGVGKKNGKTELAAALALYLLLFDEEEAPLIVCAAASNEQADLVFGAARVMCESSPTLAALTEIFAAQILVPQRPGARLLRVSAVAGTNDGKNIHGLICDELHEWTGPQGKAVWDTLTNGTGAREQPLIIQITTAGWDQESICYQQYSRGQAILAAQRAGQPHDRRFFFRWWEAEDGADYRDEATWRACNPNYNVTVRSSFYRDQLTKKTENVFRRYYCNQWTESEERWLGVGVWEACELPPWQFAPRAGLAEGEPTWVAIDASTKHDTTCVGWAQWRDGRLCAKFRLWERPLGGDGKPVAAWKIPIEEVKDTVRNLCRDFNVIHVGYDPQFLTWVADELTIEGLPMLEVPQTDARMVPAAQTFYAYIHEGIFGHDGDPDVARHLRNTVAISRGVNGAFRLAKTKARKPMDAAIVAAMLCLLGAQQPDEAPRGIGVLWLDEEGAA
jgi:phage terminase large subunit-like protein